MKNNIGVYIRMVKMARQAYYNEHKFNVDYVHMLLDKYMKVLKRKAVETYPNNRAFHALYDLFKRDNADLFLNYCGEYNIDKETGLFGYSVVFKLKDDKGIFQAPKSKKAKAIFKQVLEFFVVFLDFYKEVEFDEEENEELDEETRPKVYTKDEYGLLYLSNLKEFAVQDDRIKRFIYEKIIDKYANLNIKYNGKFEDLFEFYKEIYNKIASDENLRNKYCIFDKIADEKYFKLFNPENIKDIAISPQNVRNSILFTFKKGKLNESQSKLLKSFRSFSRKDIEYLNSKLSVSAVKQIILIYFKLAKNNAVENNKYVGVVRLVDNRKEKLKMLKERWKLKRKFAFVLDRGRDRFKSKHEEARKYIENEIMKYERLDLSDVEYSGERKDLYKFYKKLFNINSKKRKLKPAEERCKHLKLFDPGLLKYLRVINNGGIGEILIE